MITVVAACAAADGSDRSPPDAAGPRLTAVWDPRACAAGPRSRIELRLADAAGEVVVGTAACAVGSIEIDVAHVGWYWASAVALDAAGGGRAIATATLALDQPAMRWLIRWP